MIFKVPIEFEKAFENHTKYKCDFDQYYNKYTETDYNIITSKIKEIFGFDIIKKPGYFNDPICKGRDELRIFEKNGERITDKYGNNFGQYELDGILTFDNYYKRFVIFQFREHFVKSDSNFHIIDGVNTFCFYYNDLDYEYENNYIRNSKDGDINTDLTKLIVIYKESHYSQLLEYFDQYGDFNKIIELWNFLNVDDVSLINKTIVDYKEIEWVNDDISEVQFLNLFGIDEETIYKFEIFKEYLKFNFTNIKIYSGIGEKKVDKFISDVYGEYDFNNEDDYFNYSNLHIGDQPTQTITFLKMFLDEFINYYNNEFLDYYFDEFNIKKDVASVNYLDFLYCRIVVESREWNYVSDKIENLYLMFNLSFINNQIIVKLELKEGMLLEDIGELILSGSSTFSEINNYIKSYFNKRVYKNKKALKKK